MVGFGGKIADISTNIGSSNAKTVIFCHDYATIFAKIMLILILVTWLWEKNAKPPLFLGKR